MSSKRNSDVVDTSIGKVCKICLTPVRYSASARAWFHLTDYPRDLAIPFETLAREVTNAK